MTARRALLALAAVISTLSSAGCGGEVLVRGAPSAQDPSTTPMPAGPLPCADTAKASLTSTGEVDVMRTATAPDCGTVVVGEHFGTTDLGGLTQSSDDWDGFVVRLDRAGRAQWAVQIATAGSDSWADNVDDVVVDAAGNVWAHGHVGEPLTLGGTTVLGDFVLALDPSGKLRWLRQIETYARSLALGPNGDVEMYLEENGLVESVLDGATGAWIATLPLVIGDVKPLAISRRGTRTALALCIDHEVTVRGAPLWPTDDSPDGNGNPTCDLGLVVLDDGTPVLAETFEEHGFLPLNAAIDLDDQGGVALSLGYWGRIDLGLGDLSASAIGAGMQQLVATFDEAGKATTSRSLGGATLVMPVGVAWGPGGSFTAGGTLYEGSVDIEGSLVGPADGYLGFSAAFDADGGLLHATARPGLTLLSRAEAGLALWGDHSPDGVSLRTLTLSRERLP